VPALSFLDSILATGLSIWLGILLSLRFHKVEAIDPPEEDKPVEETEAPADRYLPLPPIVAIWMLYGLIAWHGITNAYLGGLPMLAWQLIGQWVPSIQALDALGRELPKLHASLLVTVQPILLLAFLKADLKTGIARIVDSNRQGLAIIFLPLLAIAPLFFGLESRRLGNEFITYALSSSALLAISAYFLALWVRLTILTANTRQAEVTTRTPTEDAIESLQMLARSQLIASSKIPTTQEIESAIRLLGRKHLMEGDCAEALADLAASPPRLSTRVTSTAGKLLTIALANQGSEEKNIRS